MMSPQDSHVKHTLDQVLKFSAMLAGTTVPDRSEAVLYAQLGFNLGRYAELVQADGRQLWRLYESCLESGDWQPLQTIAAQALDYLEKG
jgi:hypothetical protein